MSMTGPPGEPTRVGLPIRDLCRDVQRIRCPGGAARPGAHRARDRRANLTAGCDRGGAFLSGHSLDGRAPGARGPGNHHPSIAPYGLFHAADGPIQIAVGSEAQWRALAPAVGLDPADPRYATNRDRVAHRESLLAAIDSALAAESSATWLERLDKLGIPAGPGALARPGVRPRSRPVAGLVITVDHPVLGRIELPGPPLRFDDQLFAGGRGTHICRRRRSVSTTTRYVPGSPGPVTSTCWPKLAGVRVLIALGGNAMTAPGGGARPEDQIAAIGMAAEDCRGRCRWSRRRDHAWQRPTGRQHPGQERDRCVGGAAGSAGLVRLPKPREPSGSSC